MSWGQPGTHGESLAPVGTAWHPLLPHHLLLLLPGSYKSCIPEPLRCQIQQHSFLTRKRIRRRFSQSLRKIGGCQTDGRYLKLKYLLDLERLQQHWAEETFCVRSPSSALDIAIHVSGDSGISWSCGGSEVRVGVGGSARGSRGEDVEAMPGRVPPQSRQHFCDFPDIADISIKQASREGGPVENRVVTLTKTDNRVLVSRGCSGESQQGRELGLVWGSPLLPAPRRWSSPR